MSTSTQFLQVEAPTVQSPPALPSSEIPIPAQPRPVRTERKGLPTRALAFAAMAMALVAVTLERKQPAMLVTGFMTLFALAGMVVCVGWGVRHMGAERYGLAFLSALGALTSFGFTLVGALMTLWASVGFRRGRQLRHLGRIVLPEVKPEGERWTHLQMKTEIPVEVREALAAQWRENGRTEHASVGAFAKLSLDLMALGAPPHLLTDANRDAIDEIHHTELCFSLARSLDGKTPGPGPFPTASRVSPLRGPRKFMLSQLAVHSMIDGALHEGVSAKIIAQLAHTCTVPEIRKMLKLIASDEGRHSAHAWDVVEWCVEEGGQTVKDALLGAVDKLPTEMHTEMPPAAEAGAWEIYGIHGRETEKHAYRAMRESVVRRIRGLCADTTLVQAA